MKKLFIAFLTLISGLVQAQAIDFNCYPDSTEITINWTAGDKTQTDVVTITAGIDKYDVSFDLPEGYYTNPNFDTTHGVLSDVGVILFSTEHTSSVSGKLTVKGGDYANQKTINIDLTDEIYSEKVDFGLSYYHIDNIGVVLDTVTRTFYNSLTGENNAAIFTYDVPEGYRIPSDYTDAPLYVVGVGNGFSYQFVPFSADDEQFSVKVWNEDYSFEGNDEPINHVIAIDNSLFGFTEALITIEWYIDDVLSETTTKTVYAGKSAGSMSLYLDDGITSQGFNATFYADPLDTKSVKISFEPADGETILQGRLTLPSGFDYIPTTIKVKLVSTEHLNL